MNDGVNKKGSSGTQLPRVEVESPKHKRFHKFRKKVSQFKAKYLTLSGKKVEEAAPKTSVKPSADVEPPVSSPTKLPERKAETVSPVTPEVKPKGKKRFWLPRRAKENTPALSDPKTSPVLPFVNSTPPRVVIRDDSSNDGESVDTFGANYEDVSSDADIDDILFHSGFDHKSSSPRTLKAKRNLAEKTIGWVAEKALKKYLPVDSQEIKQYQEQLEKLEEQIKNAAKNRKQCSTVEKTHVEQKKKLEKELREARKSKEGLQGDIKKNTRKLDQERENSAAKKNVAKYERKLEDFDVRVTGANQKISRLEQEVVSLNAAIELDQRTIQEKTDLENQLVVRKKAVESHLEVARDRQKIFNRQLVSLILSLRRIHQKKTSLPPLEMPKLKIPVGDDHLELSNVTFNPSDIVTRMQDGHPFVDITLTDVEADILAPIEGGVKVDVRTRINPITLTIGGPIGAAFHEYLDCSKAKLAPAMGKLAKVIVKAVTSGGQSDAPVHLSADIGTVTVLTEGINTDTIVRGVSVVERTPDSTLQIVLTQLRLPVHVHVHQLEVKTSGEVDLNVGAHDLELDLDPAVSGQMGGHSRIASLGVKVGELHVDAGGPVALAAKTVSKLLPPDPLQVLSGKALSPSVLEKLPADACTEISGFASGLEVNLTRNVNKRHTKLNQAKEVWVVEGDEVTSIKAKQVRLNTAGNLQIDGTVHKVHLKTEKQGSEHDVIDFSLGEEGDEKTGFVTVTCKPALVKTLAKAFEKEPQEGETKENDGPLQHFLIDGNAVVRLDGKADVKHDNISGTTHSDIDELTVRTAPSERPVQIQTEDMRLMLPSSVKGQVQGTHIDSKVVVYPGVEKKKTKVQLDRVDLTGDGEITIDTGLDTGRKPRHHFAYPIHGKGHMTGFKVETVGHVKTDQGRKTQMTVFTPEDFDLEVEEVRSGQMSVGKVGLHLDQDLSGEVALEGVSIGFNNLVNDRVHFDAIKAKASEEKYRTEVAIRECIQVLQHQLLTTRKLVEADAKSQAATTYPPLSVDDFESEDQKQIEEHLTVFDSRLNKVDDLVNRGMDEVQAKAEALKAFPEVVTDKTLENHDRVQDIKAHIEAAEQQHERFREQVKRLVQSEALWQEAEEKAARMHPTPDLKDFSQKDQKRIGDHLEAFSSRLDRVEELVNSGLEVKVAQVQAQVEFPEVVSEDLDEFHKLDEDTDAIQVFDSLGLKKRGRFTRWVKSALRDKTLMMDGHVPVTQGAMLLNDLRATHIRVLPNATVARLPIERRVKELEDRELKGEILSDQEWKELQAKRQRLATMPRPSLRARAMAGVLSLGVRAVVFFASGRAVQVSNENGRPVVRSPILRNRKLPVGEKLESHLVVNKNGSLNIAAMQNLATGMYCFPWRTREQLDGLLTQVYSSPDPIESLDKLLGRVEEALGDSARVQEALYLLSSLNIETLINQAQSAGDNKGLRHRLRSVATHALRNPATQGVAQYLYNTGFRLLSPVSPATLQELADHCEETGRQAMNLAELYLKCRETGKAALILQKVVEAESGNVNARLLLAQVQWDQGEREGVLQLLEEAAIAGATDQVLPVLDNYIGKTPDDPETQTKMRLLKGALALRLEVKTGECGGFLSGVNTLEMLIASDSAAKGKAVEILTSRCQHAYHVKERLDLEEWEVWSDKMEKAAKRIEAGKPVDLTPEECKLGAMSFMYCFRGVYPNLKIARAMLLAVVPRTPAIDVHLDILADVEARQQKSAA
ncbi:hypothetical protein [Parendozoicomonas sp. Alg238-R29]|uniref:hypothetical protein n=1 Tax=Parendozoicomonas sp. Alg238-R29 TaxID=2993446 RepID=UPI00248EAB99|nr:hypothetical protein [Parendozoicomonas sp. Alg238-R29]